MNRLFPALLILLAGLACNAQSQEYAQLLEAAQQADPELRTLELALRKAELALRSHELEAGDAAHSIRVGNAGLSFDSPLGWELSPGYRYSLPSGWIFDVSAPISGTGGNLAVSPDIQLQLPLWKRDYTAADRTLELHEQRRQAETAMARRILAVETGLITQLAAFSAAESALQKALADEAKARKQIDQAKRLDGAREGGTLLLGLQRALASASSQLRRAELGRTRTLLELRTYCALDSLELTSMPSLSSDDLFTYDLIAENHPSWSRPAQDLDRILARQNRSGPAGLTGRLGLQSEVGSAVAGLNPALSAGINYTNPDTEGSLELSWSEARGPGLRLSWNWSPDSSQHKLLESETAALERREAELRFEQERGALRARLEHLANQREDLKYQEEDLEISLAFAREQLAIYEQWQARGVVDANELAEVRASLAELESQKQGLVLEKRRWVLAWRETFAD